MELPEHTCISCAYLCVDANAVISIGKRRRAIDNERWRGLGAGVGYPNLICYKGKLENFIETGKKPEQIRNEIIRQNDCADWVLFIGISPIAIEQRESSRESSKWAKRAFWVITATLAIAIVTLIVTLKTCAS